MRSGLRPVVHALPQPSPALPVEMTLLEQNCTEVRFAAGTVLRRKGQHYRDMFLLLHGSAEIDLESTSGEKILVSHCGLPVGEMGFLTGRAASATVTARTDTVALVRATQAKTVIPAFCDRSQFAALTAAFAPARVTMDDDLAIY